MVPRSGSEVQTLKFRLDLKSKNTGGVPIRSKIRRVQEANLKLMAGELLALNGLIANENLFVNTKFRALSLSSFRSLNFQVWASAHNRLLCFQMALSLEKPVVEWFLQIHRVCSRLEPTALVELENVRNQVFLNSQKLPLQKKIYSPQEKTTSSTKHSHLKQFPSEFPSKLKLQEFSWMYEVTNFVVWSC